MDDKKRETLYLIQLALEELANQQKITVAHAAKHWVQVAYDFLEAGEAERARDVLSRCHPSYFASGALIEQRRDDKEFDKAVEALDQEFDLKSFRADGGGRA